MLEIHWYIELPMVAIIAAMFAAAARNWGAVPDCLPVHWNLAGQPDRYRGRGQGLLLIPLITAASYVMMLALPRSNASGFAALGTTWTVFRYCDVMLAVVYGAMLAKYRGVEFSMVKVVLIAMGLFLVVVGAMVNAAGPQREVRPSRGRSSRLGRTGYAFSWSSSAFASFRSGVSKPSVNQP